MRSLRHLDWRFVRGRNDNEKVEVAVGARFPPNARAEKIDFFRTQFSDKPPDGFVKNRLGNRCCHAHRRHARRPLIACKMSVTTSPRGFAPRLRRPWTRT